VLFECVFAFRSVAEAFAKRWRFYVALGATWVVLVYGVSTASRELSGGYATTDVSAWAYLLNQAEVITRYLELVVWPQRLVAYYGWSLPVTIRDVLPSLLFVAACGVGAVILFVRRPTLGFWPSSSSSHSRRRRASRPSPPKSAPIGACTCP
jgi:hypothetical protein